MNCRLSLRRSLLVVPLLLLPLGACGSPEKALVGRWRSAEGPVLDFQQDGTVTIGGDASMGAKYSIPEDGKLQLEQELIGPVTMPLEMMGDSFRVEGQGVLGQGRVTYVRETEANALRRYTLSGAPVARGRCTESPRFSYGGSRTKGQIVPLEVAFTQGELELDPLTHTFKQTLTAQLRESAASAGQVQGRAAQVSESLEGRYEEQAGRITLTYSGLEPSLQVEGRLADGQLVLPGGELAKRFAALGTLSKYGKFHATDLMQHDQSWEAAPELAFGAASEPAE